MFWARTILIGAASLLGSFVWATGPALAGVVVASSGPSASNFPTGKKLPDNSQISLRNGDSVTILDSQGTRVLRGAGTFSVGRTGTATRNPTFAALTRQRSAQRVRTGAVRGSTTDSPPRSPNLWYIDVSQPGTVCILDTDAVRLWRPNTDGAESYEFWAADGAGKTRVTFGKEAMLAVWDVAEAPVADGARYQERKQGSSATGELVFAVLPEQPETPEELAVALIERGCNAQLDLLASTLAVAES